MNDELCWPSGCEAAVTLTFDGGYSATFDSVMPLLVEHGCGATWFLVTGSIGGFLEGRKVSPWSSWSEAVRKGMELGSHTVSHPQLRLSSMNRARRWVASLHRLHHLQSRLSRLFRASSGLSRTWPQRLVDEIGLVEEAVMAARDITQHTGVEVVSFACPHGLWSAPLLGMLQRAGFLSARTTDDGINDCHGSPYALKTKVVTQGTSLKVFNSWVEEALQCGGWLVETYHLISPKNDEGYHWWISSEDFAQHLNYLGHLPVWVATQADVIRRLSGKTGLPAS